MFSKKMCMNLFVVICLMMTGCSSMESEITNKGYNKVEVTLEKAIDGDTISVNYQNKKENVRFLLVDTPETSHPRLGEQPFGQEAKEFTANLVESAEKLELEFDIGQNRDKYGRLLAYVYVDGKMLQEELLKQGLARVAYIYEPNTRYVDSFTEIQKTAQSEGIGIWEIENYAQEDGFHPDHIKTEQEQKNQKQDTVDSSCTIKGNITSSSKIYHTSDSPWYEQTKAEDMFCTIEEAEEAGFRAPK